MNLIEPESCSFQADSESLEKKEGVMLVLSRKYDESVVINDDIIITVVSVLGNSVSLRVIAPTAFAVRRTMGEDTLNHEKRSIILTRKRWDTIVIGENITITVVDIYRGKIRLGIQAPRDVPVHRDEVYEFIHGTLPTDLLTTSARGPA